MNARLEVSRMRVMSPRMLALCVACAASGVRLSAQAGAFADTTSLASRALGLTVAASGGPRDTLGLLVAVVTRDGPADQAGITSGSRILAINGKPVRLEPNEIGQRAAADTAMTRFERAVRSSAGGPDVMLRVAGGGRTRTVSLPLKAMPTRAVPDSAPAQSPFGLRTPSSVTPPVPSAPTAVPASAPATVAATVTAEPTAAPPARPDVQAAAVPSPTPAATPTAVVAAPALDTLAGRLGDVQMELRRAARETHNLALSDSLADLDQAIASVRRRLRALAPSVESHTRVDTAAPRRATPMMTPAPASTPPATVTAPPARIALTGLELTRVSAELAAYLGGGAADAGLQVVRATDEWEPLKAGDVVLQVDGAAPDAARLRTALETRAPTRLSILRRGRTFTVTLGDGPAK